MESNSRAPAFVLGRRSFSVAGPTPTVWNLLPDNLRDQGCTESTFKQSLKTYLSRSISVQSVLDILMLMRYTNLRFIIIIIII